MLFASTWAVAQSTNLPKLTVADFTTDHQQIDTAANAIVLFEIGRSELDVQESEGGLHLNFYCTIRKKILKKDGDTHATVEVPLFKYGSKYDKIREIKASTYNLVNGEIVEDKLKKDAIFTEKVTDYYDQVKFTLPNIQENSIIEYSYRIYSPQIFNLKTWYFQSEIPTVQSEYTAVIPAIFQYNVSLKGHYPVSDTKSTKLSEHFLWGGKRQDASRMTYIMKDVPAFKEEDFMLAPVNYLSAINFELRTYHDPNGLLKNFTRTWKDIDMELLNDKEFGGQIKNKSVYSKILPTIIHKDSSKIQQAKAIYSYIQKNITWNKNLGKYAEKGIKDALQDKKGNMADINLGLVSALNLADIEAYPVIISTRSNGIPNIIHPVITDFNAVIVSAKIDGKDYLLDASDKNLPFGLLSLRSINDRGRIIYSKVNSDWISLVNQIPTKSTYNINAKISPEGLITGKIDKYYTGLEAWIKRTEVSEFPTLEEYEEKAIEKASGIRILSAKIKNQDNLEESLVETIDFEMDIKDNMQGNLLVMNPVLFERQRKNPFNLTERNFHVDLGSAQSEVYNISIQIPQGYTLERAPKNTALTLPENSAKYSYRSVFQDGILMVQQMRNLNNAIYSPEEYFHLKEFFSLLIQQQNTDFQFKKL